MANHGELVPLIREGAPPNVELIGAFPPEEVPDKSGIDGCIGYWFPTEEEAPRLRWIHCPNAGFDDLPAHVLRSKQWTLTHGGGTGAVPIAEWTLASMLFFAHRFRTILQYESERTWHKNRAVELSGSVLHGATAGIIGYGAIGRQVARLCKAFGMEVHASLGSTGKTQRPTYRTEGTGDPDGILPDFWFGMEEFLDVLPRWDYVILYARVTSGNENLICAESLRRFKRSAVLINASRGALIDENALSAALKEGLLGGAALDVFKTEPLPADDPLRDAPNLLLSPHCSPEGHWYQGEIRASMKEGIRRFAAGEQLLNVVNGE